jgi:hypothetical protein
MSAGSPKPTVNYLAHRVVVVAIAAVLTACVAIAVLAIVPTGVSWILGVITTLHDAWREMGWSLW